MLTNCIFQAQYYGICFLSQLLLDPTESLLADRLVSVYLSFFKSCVKKGEIDSKLMSALLTGVNRAFPYCDNDKANNSLEGDIKVMFRVVQLSGFNVSVQALMLIHQIMGRGDDVNDRFYSALYRFAKCQFHH
jgi:ribosome biogenesis protein MAK21